MKHQPFYYGGQAVIEGVMMRGRESVAVAVRRPNGEISVTTQELASVYKGRLRTWPLIRGIIVLIETLELGINTLLRSAQIASVEEEEPGLSPAALWGTAFVAGIFGVALFFVVPLLLTRFFVDPYVSSALLSNVIEGVLRIIIFIAYLKLTSLMSGIKRIFAYHGAEHKTVNAYEAGMPLEVDSVKKYSTAHTRCGTSFILAVLVLAIIVFALLGRPVMWVRLLTRIVFIPVIAAIAYEFIRFAAGHTGNPVVRALLKPGLALQAMTTAEPSDDQLETAIAALKKVTERSKGDPDANRGEGFSQEGSPMM